MELTEQQYKSNSSSSGGYLNEIPEPHIRKFPNPYSKRKVKITVSRYYGYGIHYYVSIREDDNPIWNSERNLWTRAWDDKEGEGKTDTDLYFDGDDNANIRTDAYELAIGKAKMVLKRHFPDHEVVWEDYCKDWEKDEQETSY